MGRCSCAGNSCNCTFAVTDDLVLEGTGNTDRPLRLSLAQRVHEVELTADGEVDLSDVRWGSVVVIRLSANVTDIILPTRPIRFELIVDQVGGNHTVAWPDEIRWPYGGPPAPSLTAGQADWYILRGISPIDWFAAVQAQALS